MSMRQAFPIIIILVALIIFGGSVFQRTPMVWNEVHSVSANNFIFNIELIEKILSGFTESDISAFKKWRPSSRLLQEEEYLYIFIWKSLVFKYGDTSFPDNIKISEKGRDIVKLWTHSGADDSIDNLLDKLQIQESSEPFDLNAIRLLVSVPDRYHERVLNKLKEYIDPEQSVFIASGIYGEEMLEVIRYMQKREIGSVSMEIGSVST